MKIFTFYMRDAWGDDYTLEVQAHSEKEARSIATLVDDYAVPEELIEIK